MLSFMRMPLEAPVTPGGVLLSHAHDQLLHLLGDTRSPKRSSLLAAVKLLRDQSLVPAHERIGSREGRHRFEALAPERVGECREAAALGIGEAEPTAAELGFENAIFLAQIRDHLLLVTLNPTGNHGNEHMQNHSVSSG